MESLLAEGQTWIKEAIPSRKALPQSLLTSGAVLAAQLRKRAIDLSYNKATEFSPDIEALHFMAAKVAYIVFGSDSPESEFYEKDANYYRSFPSSASRVAEYDEFKRTIV